MNLKQYATIEFSLTNNGTPEIYSFIFEIIPKILKKMKIEKVHIEIKRLEPLDRIHTNYDIPREKLEELLKFFRKTHKAKEIEGLNGNLKKNSLKALVTPKELAQLLKDYNTIFDLFFTNLLISIENSTAIDLMDGFSNSAIIFGNQKIVNRIVHETEKMVKYPIKLDILIKKEK